jgi:hypothetical protein
VNETHPAGIWSGMSYAESFAVTWMLGSPDAVRRIGAAVGVG